MRLSLSALALVACAARAEAQDAMPIINARLDAPLGLMIETGFLVKSVNEGEGFGGPAVTAAIGTGGWRVGAGARMVGMMGLNMAAQAVVVRTQRDPVGTRPNQTYVGAEVRGGILFGSIGLGALVRVAGETPAGGRLKLAASVGIGI